MEMYKNWVLVERHRTDYTKHGNQESRVIAKNKKLERNQDKWIEGRTGFCSEEEVGKIEGTAVALVTAT
jgi:hypothetical protein